MLNPVQFLFAASERERRALIASALGWMLNGMDVTLYAVVIPALLRELHLSNAQAGLLASLTLIASAVGGILAGVLADRAGRRPALIASIGIYIAALLVPPYSRATPATLLIVGPLLAFFGTGHFTGFGIITAELFPTSFRATAMGLTYNFGRALSAAAPWVVGALAKHGGLGSAFWISALAFLAAGLLALGIPETRGRPLH